MPMPPRPSSRPTTSREGRGMRTDSRDPAAVHAGNPNRMGRLAIPSSVQFYRFMRKVLIALLAIVLLRPLPLVAENWPQWRGPLLNGVSRDTGFPVRWSKASGLAWKLALPAW